MRPKRCVEPEPTNKLYYVKKSNKVDKTPSISQLADLGEIYCIRNNRTGFRYIGQTKCLKKINGKLVYKGFLYRFKQHLKLAFKNLDKKSSCPLFYKAIRYYGVNFFYVKLLERCQKSLLNQREIYYIKKYKTRSYGYNISRGGQRYRKKYNKNKTKNFKNNKTYKKSYKKYNKK